MGDGVQRFCWDQEQQCLVSQETVEVKQRTKTRNRKTQQAAFIRGPIPMTWLEQAASLPGKTLNAALAIWYAYSVAGRGQFTVKRQTWERMHLTRQAYYRALQNLEDLGLITVERKQGAYPLITLLKEAQPQEKGEQ